MKLTSLQLQNFRKYEDVTFRFNERFTILIGNNGKGKTTILDAIALMLNSYFQGSGIRTGARGIRKTDARYSVREKSRQFFLEREGTVLISADAEFKGESIKWKRKIGDRGGKAKDLAVLGVADREELKRGGNPNFPILLYYGAGRLWAHHEKVKVEKPTSQLDGYRFCLDPISDHKALKSWLKKLTMAQIQRGVLIPAVSAVKLAVLKCIPGAVEFFWDVQTDELMIVLEHEGLVPFSSLSDGYRNMVGMVADIAHRASKLNPHFEENVCDEVSGVVLIDELDVHLHPKWQRRLVADLKATFPKVQFIVSTHSPFVIQSITHDELIDLDDRPPVSEADPNELPLHKVATQIMGVGNIRSDDFDMRFKLAQEKLAEIKEVNGELSIADYVRVKDVVETTLIDETDDPVYKAYLIKKRNAGAEN